MAREVEQRRRDADLQRRRRAQAGTRGHIARDQQIGA